MGIEIYRSSGYASYTYITVVFTYTSVHLLLSASFIVFRAPVLVALALIELGMKYEDAVELIRQ